MTSKIAGIDKEISEGYPTMSVTPPGWVVRWSRTSSTGST